jgi:hypothetical protein
MGKLYKLNRVFSTIARHSASRLGDLCCAGVVDRSKVVSNILKLLYKTAGFIGAAGMAARATSVARMGPRQASHL